MRTDMDVAFQRPQCGHILCVACLVALQQHGRVCVACERVASATRMARRDTVMVYAWLSVMMGIVAVGALVLP